jgi:predicted DCC family thiol-disulfide oxidoreductase YuxK
MPVIAAGKTFVRDRWDSLPIDGAPDRLILFDGVCVFCSRWARFVIARDSAAQFRFVAVQDPFGQALASRLGISTAFPETNAVILAERAFFKSDAAIAVLSHLPHWSWVRLLAWVPRRLRDGAYDVIARNRYRWFGRTESCLVPTPEMAGRFWRDGAPPD